MRGLLREVLAREGLEMLRGRPVVGCDRCLMNIRWLRKLGNFIYNGGLRARDAH